MNVAPSMTPAVNPTSTCTRVDGISLKRHPVNMTMVQRPQTCDHTFHQDRVNLVYQKHTNGNPTKLLAVMAITTRLSISAIVEGTNAKLASTSIAATFASTLMGA